MNKEIAIWTGILLLFISMMSATQVRAVGAVNIVVPDDYPTIQAAINAANHGDTVIVNPDIYYEHIVVNKSIALFGEYRSATIIDGSGSGPVLYVTSSNVNITGFTLQNSGINMIVQVDRAGYFYLIGNLIEGSVLLRDAERSRLINNTITGESVGILVYSSGRSFFRNNTIRGSSRSSFLVEGRTYVDDYFIDIDSTNTVDGKPIWYLVNRKDLVVSPETFPSIGYLGIIDSTNITVQDISVSDNWQGLLLAGVTDSTVKNMTSRNNTYGIDLFWSRNNTIGWNKLINGDNDGIRLFGSTHNFVGHNEISGYENPGIRLDSGSTWNNVSWNFISESQTGITLEDGNTRYNSITANTFLKCFGQGILVCGSPDNSAYWNTFLDNTPQVRLSSISPVAMAWDNGREGNYWSDYTGQDLDKDGIGDTPYIIDDINQDNYPLMNPEYLIDEKKRFSPLIDGYSFNNQIPKESVSFWDALEAISTVSWSSTVPVNYLPALAWLSTAVHNLQLGNCFGMSYTAKYYYEHSLLFDSNYPSFAYMYEVDMTTASPEILTNQFPGQLIIPPSLIDNALVSLGLTSLDEEVPWILSQLDSYNVVQLSLARPNPESGIVHTFHSVLVYDYELVGDQVRLYIYDPNHQGATRYIVLSTDGHGSYEILGGNVVSEYEVTQIAAGEFYDISWSTISGYVDELVQLVYELATSSCDDFLAFEAESPVNILVTAPDGLRVGYDSSTESEINEISGATYSGAGTEPQTILIPSPSPGNYTIHVFGTGLGSYTITAMSTAQDGSIMEPITWTGEISAGELQSHSIQLSEEDGLNGDSSGGFPGTLLIAAATSAVIIVALTSYVLLSRRKKKTATIAR